MNKDVFNNHRTNTIIISVLVILFISVIYLPKSIWDYEDELRDESRFRMQTVGSAEKLHYQLARTYTTDSEQLLYVVNSVRDSLMAAAGDSNYSYYGDRRIALPGKSISVNYSEEYHKYYEALHLELFKLLEPNHYMDPNDVSIFLDTVKVLFDNGNYSGAQSMELDSISLSFNVSDKYDILYQNIKTSMFNALTNGSYTKYPEFSNPLVDAVMDSLEKNPELGGLVDFSGIYDGSVRIDFIIPTKFEENLEKSKLALKKQFIVDAYDSATYGDTLYEMALADFFTQNDTSEFIPEFLTLMYADTSGEEIAIPVEVKVEDMYIALDKRRNTLYTMLTGYSEPSPLIASTVIDRAIDSLVSPNVGMDSFFVDIDLSEAIFSINIHSSVAGYFNTVALEQAYYKSTVNLTDLDWNKIAIEVVELIAEKLKSKDDFLSWQIVEVASDTLHVNVFEEFLRKYDDMNLKLFEKLTGNFTNIFDHAYELVSKAELLANDDTLGWSGTQVIEFSPDTLLVNVFPKYLEEYDTTFTIPRDTVVRVNDSTFNGVWYRNKIGVTQDYSADTLAFLIASDNSNYRYEFEGTDSVRSLNIMEKSDTSRVERIYYGEDSFVILFSEDSIMENLFVIADEYSLEDSVQIDSLNIVSDEFVVGAQEKHLFMDKDSFGGWIDTVINKKFIKKQLFSHYLLEDKHMKCSVTELPYRITVRNDVNLAVESPIVLPIKTNRYLFFTQVDSSHGSIVDGEFSWAK